MPMESFHSETHESSNEKPWNFGQNKHILQPLEYDGISTEELKEAYNELRESAENPYLSGPRQEILRIRCAELAIKLTARQATEAAAKTEQAMLFQPELHVIDEISAADEAIPTEPIDTYQVA